MKMDLVASETAILKFLYIQKIRSDVIYVYIHVYVENVNSRSCVHSKLQIKIK
jgi:hypothetical protein